MIKDSGRKRKILMRLLKGAGIIVLFFIILDRMMPLDTSIAFAPIVTARDGTVLHAYRARDGQWRLKTRPEEITPELKKAIIFKEDKYFYYHLGINPFAAGRAMINNVLHRKRTSGASTITMQVARLLDPKPRTYTNKFAEMMRAMQLELHCSKDEIFQLYLNLIPYGSNIQGVKAASLLYFNKMPDHLSLAEITALSIIPNRPNSLTMGKDNNFIITQRNKWLHIFLKKKLFPATEINDALNEPLTAYRHNAPSAVPQFAFRMKSMQPNNLELSTTIDAKLQLTSESIVTNYVNQLKLRNINNAAVLVIDNKTHEVLTYIGSSDFTDKPHFGQVDGVIALRSPGSTLKPLLYGLCINKGLVTPKTMIADVPVNIKGYSPENYDRMFRGNVTTEFALSHSLNIPAVKLLEQEGLDDFLNVLTKTGFNSIKKSRKDIGLSVILGGCGVRLDELVALYASFANNGRYYPLQYMRRDGNELVKKIDSIKHRTQDGVPVLTPSANYMLTRILSELHRPDLPNAYDEAKGIPRIAWKTGTSYGRKDAWSIGYNNRYTIGVWLGNFSAAGVQELSGSAVATPLLFQLFNVADHHSVDEWLEPPAGLSFRLVCAETGKIPNDFCHNQVMDYYIPGISPNDRCQHLKEMWLSPDERYSYCTSCLPVSGYKTKLIANIPAELVDYYERANVPYAKIPPHYPTCTRTFGGQAPIITSLTNDMTYLIENKEQQKLQLSCTAANDVKKVYWYINDKFYASTEVNQKLFFSAPSSVLKISCSDDKGRNTNIAIKVKFI